MEPSSGGQRWGCRLCSRCVSFFPQSPHPQKVSLEAGPRFTRGGEAGSQALASPWYRPQPAPAWPPGLKEAEAARILHTSCTFPAAACLPALPAIGRVHFLPWRDEPAGMRIPSLPLWSAWPRPPRPSLLGPRAPQPAVHLHFKATQCRRSGRGCGKLGEATWV